MLNSKQRAQLRSLANSLESQFQVGKGEIDEHVVTSLDEYMTTHELVKITILKTADETPNEIATRLAAAVSAEVVQVIGRKLVFYRYSPKLAKLGKSLTIRF
ncbi:MAG: YhbY family RNA-binding protein [Eubacteriales bacterium]|nr:YhbY family RNA-binding protein [Eubacteriales bacterium]